MNNHHHPNPEHNRPEGAPSGLSERVMGRIGTEHIEPRSRLAFTAENWLFWLLGALSIVLGSLASAAALFELANAGWYFYVDTHKDLLTFVLAAAPFLWLLALALFILIGYENIRRTKRGYRYPFAIIVAGAVLTSVVLGTALFAAGFGEEIEEAVGDHPPFYRPVVAQEHAWWLRPERGLLGGDVVAVSIGTDSFTLKDFSGHIWIIDASGLATTSSAVVERGGTVRVEGIPDASATSTLYACAVYPWQTYGADTEDAPRPPFAVMPRPPERSPADARNQSCKGTRLYEPPSAANGE